MIEIRNVTKRFGRVTALDGVTLSIGAGEKLAFVGANGSGKTTLLRAVLGLVRVEGEVTIAGVDVARKPWSRCARWRTSRRSRRRSRRPSSRSSAPPRRCEARATRPRGRARDASASTSASRDRSASAICRAA
ncbi:MAG: ATP-binding cassette domain-containing protein [Labilithrix sp.]